MRSHGFAIAFVYIRSICGWMQYLWLGAIFLLPTPKWLTNHQPSPPFVACHSEIQSDFGLSKGLQKAPQGL